VFHALTAAADDNMGNVQGDTPQAFGVLLHSITEPSKFFFASGVCQVASLKWSKS
jgi:hypothetical protein